MSRALPRDDKSPSWSMGATLAAAALSGAAAYGVSQLLKVHADAPRHVVLAPPLFETWKADEEARVRLTQQPFAYLFGRRERAKLFHHYVDKGFGGSVELQPSPAADSVVQINVRAHPERTEGSFVDGAVAFCLNQELPNPRALFGRNSADAPPAVFTMDASLQRAGWLRARGALYDPGSHMALFADVPVALVPDEAMGAVPFATDAEDGQPRAGVRYSSATTSAGASVDPLGVARGAASERAGLPATVWLARRAGSLTVGAKASLSLLSAGKQQPDNARGNVEVAATQPGMAQLLQRMPRAEVGSLDVGVSYTHASPDEPTEPAYQVSLELREWGREVVAGYYQHIVTQRRVHNPFEKEHVVGILNYIRLGFEVVQRVRGAPQRPPASQNAGVAADAAVRTASPVPLHVPPPDLRLAVAWQLNKNLLVKAKVDSQDLAVAAAFKSWAHPTVTVAGSVGYDMVRRSPRVGAEVRVENVGTPRYQLPQPEYRDIGTPTRTIASREVQDRTVWQDAPVLNTGIAQAAAPRRRWTQFM